MCVSLLVFLGITMLKQSMIALASAAAIGAVFASSSEAASLIGISLNGDVFSINSETGTGTFLGNSGFGGNSAASDSSGTVYTVSSGGIFGTLVQIDPLTGAGTAVAPVSTSRFSVRGLAFDENDILYAVLSQISVDTVDVLATIDINTGLVSQIGPISNLTSIQSLAFSPDGRLFGQSVARALYELNPLTGDASLVGGTGIAAIQALEFTSDGSLLGIRNQLFEIDPATGATNLVGDGGYTDIRGLALIPSIPEDVPEPASVLGLLAVGVIAAGSALKKKPI